MSVSTMIPSALLLPRSSSCFPIFQSEDVTQLSQPPCVDVLPSLSSLLNSVIEASKKGP